jgi:glycosyltransferase involved in cell wall biosynthesis
MVEKLPVTVIIPCGDNIDTLPRSFLSVVNQIATPAQIVIVYNSSNPLSEELRRYLISSNVLILEFPKLIGPSQARNLGLSSSSQEYVAFLDADDEWEPNKLLLQFKFMEENSYSLSTTDFRVVDSATAKTWTIHNGNCTKTDIHRRCHVGFGSTAMMRKNHIAQALLFDETLLRFEDWDFMLRSLNSRISYGNLRMELTVVNRLPSKNWKLAKKALIEFKEKHSKSDLWDRHLASGIYLEKAVIQFRERNPLFSLNILLSLLRDSRQVAFYLRNFKVRLMAKTGSKSALICKRRLTQKENTTAPH